MRASAAAMAATWSARAATNGLEVSAASSRSLAAAGSPPSRAWSCSSIADRSCQGVAHHPLGAQEAVHPRAAWAVQLNRLALAE